MLISQITFNSEEYYSLLSPKLLDSGLTIGYEDYHTTKSSSYAKSAAITFITLLMLILLMLFILLPT